MNIPNKLIILRLVFACCILILFFFPSRLSGIFILLLYLMGNIADTIDGMIARKYEIVTDFGKFFDPLADKILIVVVVFPLIAHGIIGFWVGALFEIRELLVLGLRIMCISKDHVVMADKWGKLKVWSQGILMILGLIEYIAVSTRPNIELVSSKWITVFSFIAVFMSLISGINYYLKNKSIWSKIKM